jgi:hypothetical protein
MAKSRSKKSSPPQTTTKLIVGVQPWLAWALAEWKENAPKMRLIPLELKQDAAFNFDFASFDAYKSRTLTAFAAFGDAFLNLKRHELYMKLKTRGFALPPLVDKDALVTEGVTIGENAWIRKGAVIGAGTKIGIGAHMGIAAMAPAGCILGEHVTLHDGARLGNHCRLGMFTTIGGQVTLADSTELAAFSRLVKPGVYRGVHKEAVFFEERFEAMILS